VAGGCRRGGAGRVGGAGRAGGGGGGGGGATPPPPPPSSPSLPPSRVAIPPESRRKVRPGLPNQAPLSSKQSAEASAGLRSSMFAASARAALARSPFSGAQTTRHPQPPNQPSARRGCWTSRGHQRKPAPSSNGSPIGLKPSSPSLSATKRGRKRVRLRQGRGRESTLDPPLIPSCTPTPPPSRFSLSRAPRRTEGQLIHSTSTQPP